MAPSWRTFAPCWIPYIAVSARQSPDAPTSNIVTILTPQRETFQALFKERRAYDHQKRILDITLAGGALVLLSPLALLVAVAIRLDDETKVDCDREYAIRRSLRLDAAILWQTFAAVLTSRGNY